VVRQQLLQVPGEQLLLHGQPHPGPGLAHVRLNLTYILDMPADTSHKEVKGHRHHLDVTEFSSFMNTNRIIKIGGLFIIRCDNQFPVKKKEKMYIGVPPKQCDSGAVPPCSFPKRVQLVKTQI